MDGVDRLIGQWAEQKPHLDTAPMAVLGRLLRLTKHIESQLSACQKQFGLNMGEFDVLATLRRAGAPYRLTPSDLLGAMMLTSGAMTNRLDKLEAKQLIERVHSKADRRSVSVALTTEGVALIDKAVEAHVASQQQLVKQLSAQELVQINQLLKGWLQSFEE
ncbi:MarR family winged helix-turn-helix transcriptional regulator [Shewanella waksmanii]|uniref:MarR family winged helix-turn-helix transcriptional regulator n=1 Tax=Shewanella waksmanii TaxID=213783 RepID=UPI0037369BE6